MGKTLATDHPHITECMECHQWGDPVRYHPYLFCELIKAGITDDPEVHLALYGFTREQVASRQGS